ncbi:MAG: nitrate reductase [Kordiimonas sp.]|nr:nitrate reductase [Kordiimonas sp.]
MTSPVKTTCPYCGVGCGVITTTDADGKTHVAGDPDHPANYGKLCSKGSALGDTLGTKDRLLTPRLYGQDVSWAQALDHVAAQLTATIREYGPDSVAFYVSGQLLTEDYYVANKLMKGFIGSANIDTNSRLCMSSSVAGHKRAFGEDIVPGHYDDWDKTDLAVLVGSNAAWCHPILFQRLIRNQNERGMKMVIIDPRRTPSCDSADLHLPIRPGTDVSLFNGLLVYLADNGFEDSHYCREYTRGHPDALQAAREDAPDLLTVAQRCDISPDRLEAFYQLFSQTENSLTIYSQGVNQSSQGTDKVNAIINCHLFTGRIGRPGQGPFSVTGQPNAMGGREVGGLANTLAAHMDFDDDSIQIVKEFWQTETVATQPGLKAIDLFNHMAEGKIKALWVMGTNPAASVPNANLVHDALQKCPLVIVSDCIDNTDTLQHAHIALPAQGWGEKDGTVTNSERRISRQRRFLAPAGQAKADFWILAEVAKRMGWQDAFDYESPADVFREYSALTAYKNDNHRGLNLSGLADLAADEYNHLSPIQWPVPAAANNPATAPATHANDQRFFAQGGYFTPDGRARFVPVRYIPPQQETSPTFPIVLNSGRLRDQWHTMTRTGKSARLNDHIKEPLLTLHPEDAKKHNLVSGSFIKVKSRQGDAILRCDISDNQRRGEAFMPMHWNNQYAAQACVAQLAQNNTDPLSGQPEMKYTPINMALWKPDWSGLLITRTALTLPNLSYWTKRLSTDCFVYQIAAKNVEITPQQFIDHVFDDFPAQNIQSVQDRKKSTAAIAAFHQNRLERLFFTHSGTVQYQSAWLEKLFAKEQISTEDRRSLLAGKSAQPQEDVGPLICSCFGVGANQIKTVCQDNPHIELDGIGEILKAGTNCGSCRSEIRNIVEKFAPAANERA